MATATIPTVVLDREQRNACCELVWEDVGESHGAGRTQFVVAAGRLFEALDWRNEDSDCDSYVLPVDEEIVWLTKHVFEPNVDEFSRPGLEENLAREERDEFPSLLTDDFASRAWYREHRREEIRRYRARISATDMLLDAVA
jgi:hypothetical protein